MDWLATLLSAFRTATGELKELRVAWWLVGASIVAAIAVGLLGSGAGTIVAVGITLAGIVLSIVVTVLANSAATGKTFLLVPARVLTWAVVIFFVVFLLFTIAAVLWGQPCNWARILTLPYADCPSPQRVGVHIKRVGDAAQSHCDGNVRVFKEVIVDQLSFEGPVQKYEIQARKKDIETHTLSVKYSLEGQERAPIVTWTPGALPTDSQHWFTQITVNGRPLVVEYTWDQRPNDNDFGFSVVSSLPILSFHAVERLPLKTRISGTDKRYPFLLDPFAKAGCSFSEGSPAKLDCDGPLNNRLNEVMTYPWVWDLFDAC